MDIHGLLRRTSLLTFGLALTFASISTARAEHGMPGYTFFPADNMKLARNGRVFLLNSNGVAWSPASVRKARPVLRAGKSRVPLRIVDRFDDMEGHARPFAEGEGYGSSMIVMQPTRTLAASTTYELRMTIPQYGGSAARETVASFITTARADLRKPVWLRGPALSVDRDGGKQSATINIGVHDDRQPVLLEVRARTVGARKGGRDTVRMLTLIGSVWGPPGIASSAGEKTHDDDAGEGDEEEEEGGDESCSWVYIYDHEHGVIGDREHRKTGRLYEFSVAAIDMAGNRRAAVGPPVSMVWPDDGITICNSFAPSPRHTDNRAPRWQKTPEIALAPAHQASSYLASYERYAPGWQIFTELAGETLPFYVIAELFPVGAAKKGRRGTRRPVLRMMAKVHPPASTGTTGTSGVDYGCTSFSYATALGPDEDQPPVGARYRLRLMASDPLGNRSAPAGRALDLIWTGVLPQLCNTARANPRPLSAAKPLAVRGPVTLSNTGPGPGGRQIAAPYTVRDANVIDIPVVAQSQPYLVKVLATRVRGRARARARARTGKSRVPERFVAWALLDPRQQHPRLQCAYATFEINGRGDFSALGKNPAVYDLSVSVVDLHGRTVRTNDAALRATWSDSTQLAVCPASPQGASRGSGRAP